MRQWIYKYLNDIGVEVQTESASEITAFCPFHDNKNTGALFINKNTGLWHCMNPSCAKKGRFADFIYLTGGNKFKFIPPKEKLDALEEMILKDEIEKKNFEVAMERITIDYSNIDDRHKLQYMVDRGFALTTLQHFEVGFSEAKQRIVIPVRNEQFTVVGFIGRAISTDQSPKYLYTKKFPRKDVLFNLNHALVYHSVVVVEGSLDAMKVHQAGIPNVIATLGSTLSKRHFELLEKHFDKITVFSDADDAGVAMRDAIISVCGKKHIEIAQVPEGANDPGDLREEEIRETLQNTISDIDYQYDKLGG